VRLRTLVSLEIFTKPSDPGTVSRETRDYLREIERLIFVLERKK
jgi:hypothetical protein